MSNCNCTCIDDHRNPTQCSLSPLNVIPSSMCQFILTINAGGFLNGSFFITSLGCNNQGSLFLYSPNLTIQQSFLNINLPNVGDNSDPNGIRAAQNTEQCIQTLNAVPKVAGNSIDVYILQITQIIGNNCPIQLKLSILGSVSTWPQGTFNTSILQLGAGYTTAWPSWSTPGPNITMYLSAQPFLKVTNVPSPFIMPNSPSANRIVADYNGLPPTVTLTKVS